MGSLDWQEQGVCREVGGDWFFPDDEADGGGGVQARFAQAKKLCAACPVWQECRLAGMGESHGVWGGLSPRERREIRAVQIRDIARVYWGSTLDEGDGPVDALRRMIGRIWSVAGTVEATLEELPLLDNPVFYRFAPGEVADDAA